MAAAITTAASAHGRRQSRFRARRHADDPAARRARRPHCNARVHGAPMAPQLPMVAIALASHVLACHLLVSPSRAATHGPGVFSPAVDDDSASTSRTYPRLFAVGDIVENWPPDDMLPPPTFAKHDSLRRLNYGDEAQRAEALKLRNAELPFIVYNVPAVEALYTKWDDAYFESRWGASPLEFTTSRNNHFMFYNGHAKGQHKSRAPDDLVDDNTLYMEDPTGTTWATWANFSAKAKTALPPDEEHWYLQFGSDSPRCGFINEDLPNLRRGPPSFFIVDDTDYRGIHVRFGMGGVIAEAHYDGHRNFIAVMKGHKRYLLSPPDRCGSMGLILAGGSARHTKFDWSQPLQPSREYQRPASEAFLSAGAIDTVLSAGDVLYVPSFYFHNPISLDQSFQANARSGVSPLGGEHILDCGFAPSESHERPETARSLRLQLENGEIPLPPLPMPPGGKLTTGERPLIRAEGAALPEGTEQTKPYAVVELAPGLVIPVRSGEAAAAAAAEPSDVAAAAAPAPPPQAAAAAAAAGQSAEKGAAETSATAVATEAAALAAAGGAAAAPAASGNSNNDAGVSGGAAAAHAKPLMSTANDDDDYARKQHLARGRAEAAAAAAAPGSGSGAVLPRPGRSADSSGAEAAVEAGVVHVVNDEQVDGIVPMLMVLAVGGVAGVFAVRRLVQRRGGGGTT